MGAVSMKLCLLILVLRNSERWVTGRGTTALVVLVQILRSAMTNDPDVGVAAIMQLHWAEERHHRRY